MTLCGAIPFPGHVAQENELATCKILASQDFQHFQEPKCRSRACRRAGVSVFHPRAVARPSRIDAYPSGYPVRL